MPRQPEFRQGTGSGVIFRADGYILTNYHVVDGADQVLVTLNNEQEYQAHVVGRDPKTDLAVLRIQASEALPVATLGDSDALQVGDWVVAIGNPFGLDHTVTAGIVSAKGRVIGAGPYDDFIQTDASINPGNSGGPLLNMRGEVVGINTAIVPNGQGIGFAIPINTAKPLIPQLVSTGKVTRGYLGLNMQTLTPALTQTLKLSDRKGALVSEVTPGSPAAKAGLQRGDVIVTFDGKQVESAHDLATLVAATPVGKNVSVMILRDGNKQTVPLTVGRMPSDEVQS
jgi:serine protease Do